MNADNTFEIDLGGNTKQIDVVAIDDETCVFVECKATKTLDRTHSFKQELESIHGYYKDACKAIEEKYGPKKFAFIFATKNYYIADDSADMQRMDSFGLCYMNHDTIDYYGELVKHLGSAARYQLLGNLFKDEEISGLNAKVPALKGTMGGLDYYTFLIEPEKLLKLSYILHRNKANHLLMPTYQRLIKKDRLNAIRDFVNKGGFFPNSLIVSIDSGQTGIEFQSLSQSESTLSETGVLSLPPKYHSVYVIDGQHRLYGYSDSTHVSNNVVPVVAFVNLPAAQQVKMFMEINENQKRVSKTLRNTLNIDLLWEAENPKDRKDALMLKIAEALGEEADSPLYGRILTGEDKETNLRCITTDYIKDAIKRSSFLNNYGAHGVKTQGTFDKGNNDGTYPLLLAFLKKCFETISSYCSEEWKLGRDGFLAINNSIYAIIKVIDDIVNINLEGESYTIGDVDGIYAKCEQMILELCEAIDELNAESKSKIKKAKGGGAKNESWRTLQVALNSKDPSFTSADLVEYIENNCAANNPQAEQYIQEIEQEIKKRFREELEKTPDWRNTKLPEQLAIDIGSKLGAENARRSRLGQSVIDEWGIITFEDIARICTHSNNWSTFAQSLLTRPSGGNRTSLISQLKDMGGYKTKLKANKPITNAEFEAIKEWHKDFCENDSNN